MSEPIRVAVLGTGRTGAGVARRVRATTGLELAGVFARRPERAGQDIGRLLGEDEDWGVIVGHDLAAVINAGRPVVAIQATGGTLEDAGGEIQTCINAGVAVISLADEMINPAEHDGVFATALDRNARANQVAVTGAGFNPGYIQDLLLLGLSGVCRRIDGIHVERVSDLANENPRALESLGVGLTEEAFKEGVESGRVTGYRGGRASLHLLGSALGLSFDDIEATHAPVLTRMPRRTEHVDIPPTMVAGCRSTATAWQGETALIRLVNYQVVYPYLDQLETGDSIRIDGEPNLKLTLSPDLDRDQGTCDLAVNMIPRILDAAPGLHRMADLPLPVAILGDARERLLAKS